MLITSELTFDVVRDAVAGLGLPLTRMEQRRHRVEELFRDPGELAGTADGSGRWPLTTPPARDWSRRALV